MAAISTSARAAASASLERVDLVERQGLVLVGEQDVDLIGHEVAPGLSVALDAERVRERERDTAAGVVGHAAGLPVGLLGLRAVEEVALEERDLGGRDQLAVDVLRSEELRRAQVRVHRALGVRCDDDQAATGGRALRRGRRPEHHARGPHVVREHRAQLIVEHSPDVGGLAAEAGDAGDGVGGRSARRLDARSHRRVELVGPFGVDEGHRPLDQAVGLDELVGLVGEHVDEGVADPHDVEGGRLIGGRSHG